MCLSIRIGRLWIFYYKPSLLSYVVFRHSDANIFPMSAPFLAGGCGFGESSSPCFEGLGSVVAGLPSCLVKSKHQALCFWFRMKDEVEQVSG